VTDEQTTDTPGDETEVRSRTRTRARRSTRSAQEGAEAPTDSTTDSTTDSAGADDAPVRRKTRSRRPRAETAGDEAPATAGSDSDAGDTASGDAPAPRRRTATSRSSTKKAAAPTDTADERDTPRSESGGDAADGDDTAAPARRRRTRSTAKAESADAAAATPSDADTPSAPATTDDSTDAAAKTGDSADDDSAEAESGATASRRRRRGGRGRGRRGGRNRARTGSGADAADDDEISTVDDDGDGDATPTRLQARNRGNRTQSARTTSRGRGRASSASARTRRPLGGVSDETRRAINEGPPRRMLVTEGQERTQIAVLEERSLVEHYVTRREDISYVGNIYMGRIQNVLPGMEAAFVDIGKGRNGVLYAGEVNYDEADLEGDLPRIEHTLKSGQAVLVQVTKDPMGTKGARLTQQLSIAGRYCVLAPGEGMLGISRKLTDDERERLRKILKGLRPEGYGLIVRTAAEGATREQLEADISRLVRIWDEVNAKAEKAKPLEPVYEEPNLVIRVIRDVFGTEYSDLIVDSEPLAEQIRTYLGDVSPDFLDKVKVHSGDEHIFDAYEVTNQIRRALEKKVWLKSGGYLIIEKTEAMWVIDVNTGKFVGERNLEETVLRNNIEAATEIARQLRLRDMGGIIVIDFVDMLVPANRDEVLKRFRRELARDKTKSRVMEISKLGLVQMTRKNVSHGLQESFTSVCDVCEGRGATITEDMLR
jgi:Rne/Rng family ribonuclease